MTKPAAWQGCRVLVTRPAEGAEPLLDRLMALGAEPILAPTIAFEPPADPTALPHVLAAAGAQAWVVITSPTAARLWLQIAPDGLVRLLAAVGEATARILTDAGQTVALVAERATGADLAEALLANSPAETFVLPRSDRALATLPERLRAAGRNVIEVELYRTVPRHWSQAERVAVAAGFHLVLLMSPSALEGLLAQPGIDPLLAPAKLIAMGPTTAAACRRLLGRVDAVAEPPSLEGLIAATLSVTLSP